MSQQKIEKLNKEIEGHLKEIKKLKKKMKQMNWIQYKYLPVGGDMIDQSLASFINTYPEQDRIRVMFLRESYGIYRFGQKQVSIKVATGNSKGSQIQIKVGGGYMTAEEFIQTYTDQEVKKIEKNKNILKRFKEKLCVQQITTRKSTTSRGRLSMF